MNKSINIVLKEMCNRVNTNYDEIDFQQNDWYFLYEWTQKEENEFAVYLTNLLYNDKEARRDIMSVPIKNKEIIKKTVDFFVMNYGWKIKV
jgi:hypothetical protein